MLKLSVVIITINRINMLSRALGAILRNTYAIDEIIIVDQSNNDTTRRFVGNMQKVNPLVHYMRCESKGAGRARNIGAAYSSGEIVAFIDDDCVPEKDWAQHIIDFFNSHVDAVVIFGNVIPVLYNIEEGRVSGGRKFDRCYVGRKAMISRRTGQAEIWLSGGSYPIHCGVLMRY